MTLWRGLDATILKGVTDEALSTSREFLCDVLLTDSSESGGPVFGVHIFPVCLHLLQAGSCALSFSHYRTLQY